MKEQVSNRISLEQFSLSGHFIYTSGLHGATYFNKDALYAEPSILYDISSYIVQAILADKIMIDAVIGPAVGGAILAQTIAYNLLLQQKNDVKALYVDKVGEELRIGRGYDRQLKNRKVLVVEDVINTGLSIGKVISEVKRYGGEVEAVACICNRGQLNGKSLGVDTIYVLLDLDLMVYDANKCPLCAKGLPITKGFGRAK